VVLQRQVQSQSSEKASLSLENIKTLMEKIMGQKIDSEKFHQVENISVAYIQERKPFDAA
jgi:hypothetical protein